jgi:3-hydroxyacyl-CoA dehydrogenase
VAHYEAQVSLHPQKKQKQHQLAKEATSKVVEWEAQVASRPELEDAEVVIEAMLETLWAAARK